jgi:hypothetical protein
LKILWVVVAVVVAAVLPSTPDQTHLLYMEQVVLGVVYWARAQAILALAVPAHKG